MSSGAGSTAIQRATEGVRLRGRDWLLPDRCQENSEIRHGLTGDGWFEVEPTRLLLSTLASLEKGSTVEQGRHTGYPGYPGHPGHLIPLNSLSTPAPPLTAESPHQHIDALAAKGTQQHYRRGELLIREGEAGDSIYIVLHGRLRAFLADHTGKELTLGVYGPQEYVGEMSLDGGPRSAYVEALEATTCSVVSRDVLLAFIAARPEFALELMGRLIRRARLATECARSVALIDVYGRLVRLLHQLAAEPGPRGERRLVERLTHQAMAQHLACSREMVSRLLRDLVTGGYIAVEDRWITLLKPLPARW